MWASFTYVGLAAATTDRLRRGIEGWVAGHRGSYDDNLAYDIHKYVVGHEPYSVLWLDL